MREKNTPHQFISPKKALKHLGLKEGETVIDFGCGAGHWVIAAASIVGSSGLVIATDEDPEMLAMVVGQAKVRGFSNIDTKIISLEKGVGSDTKVADLVIISNVLHLVRDKEKIVGDLSRLVSDNGKLLFVDWLPKKTLMGPSEKVRLSEEYAIGIFEKAGLKFACMVDAGNQHFGLVFDRIGDGCGWK